MGVVSGDLLDRRCWGLWIGRVELWYGRWEQRGGQSFWVFYGQYALMRDLMGWGGRTIYRNDYDDYRTSRDQRRPYYGRRSADGRGPDFTEGKSSALPLLTKDPDILNLEKKRSAG